MQAYILNNDLFTSIDSRDLSFQDRGFLFGHGVFTSIRLQNGILLQWEEHLARLKQDCYKLRISLPQLRGEDLLDFIQDKGLQRGIWKLKIIVSAGDTDTLLRLDLWRSGKIYLILEPFQDSKNLSWSLISLSVCRSSDLVQSKTLSYLENAWFFTQALAKNCNDALLCDKEGCLLETSTAAIIWIEEDILYYPSFDLPLLPSTTLKKLCRFASKLNLKPISCKKKLREVSDQSYWYALNALRGAIPIHAIDHENKPQSATLSDQLNQVLDFEFHYE